MSAVFYKLEQGLPVPCSWHEAFELLKHPEGRVEHKNMLANGYQVTTQFLVVDVDPLRPGLARLWSTIVVSTDGKERIIERYTSQEDARRGHSVTVSFLTICG